MQRIFNRCPGHAPRGGPDHEGLQGLPVELLSLPCEAVELVVGELDEVGAEGAPFEEVTSDEDVVDARLDDGVHGLGEGPAEGSTPVLGYREGDAAPDMGVGEDCELQFYHRIIYFTRS